MEIITSLEAVKTEYSPSVIALGTFDGLHLGHQDIIKTARDYAQKHGLKLIVFTFSNHPLSLIKPDLVPVRIITQQQKIKYLEKLGVDILVNVPFDHDLAGLSPDEFLKKLAVFNYRCLVVGENFSYGFLGSGKTDTLQRTGLHDHFTVIIRQLVKCGKNIISSTGIRSLIQAGHVEHANQMLGRAYALTGIVTHGAQRGRTIGFPTANIELQRSETAVPATGGYAVKVKVGDKLYFGMANIGNNPTFGDVEHARLEVNLFDFEGDLYGREITVYFYKYIRGEEKFASIDELKARITEDRGNIKNYFQCYKK